MYGEMFEFLLSDSYVNVGSLVVQIEFYVKTAVSFLVSLLIHFFWTWPFVFVVVP